MVKRCPIQNLIEKPAPFRTNSDRVQRRKEVRSLRGIFSVRLGHRINRVDFDFAADIRCGDLPGSGGTLVEGRVTYETRMEQVCLRAFGVLV